MVLQPKRAPVLPRVSTLSFTPPIDMRVNAVMLPAAAGGQVSCSTLNGRDMLDDTAGYFVG